LAWITTVYPAAATPRATAAPNLFAPPVIKTAPGIKHLNKKGSAAFLKKAAKNFLTLDRGLYRVMPAHAGSHGFRSTSRPSATNQPFLIREIRGKSA
jgi:hypothetical protein